MINKEFILDISEEEYILSPYIYELQISLLESNSKKAVYEKSIEELSKLEDKLRLDEENINKLKIKYEKMDQSFKSRELLLNSDIIQRRDYLLAQTENIKGVINSFASYLQKTSDSIMWNGKRKKLFIWLQGLVSILDEIKKGTNEYTPFVDITDEGILYEGESR